MYRTGACKAEMDNIEVSPGTVIVEMIGKVSLAFPVAEPLGWDDGLGNNWWIYESSLDGG